MGLLANARRGVRSLLGMGVPGGYEAAAGGRRLKQFVPTRAHINTLIAAAGPDVLARARYLTRNNGYAFNAVEAWTGNAIGTGITPVFKVPAKSVKKKITDRWNEWVDVADADGIFDFFGVQRRAAREAYIAGECFVRMRTRRESDGLPVPMQLQVLPSEMLPLNKNEELPSGNYIQQGIEFDAIGRRVAYHFYRQHPGDFSRARGNTLETVRVPAIDVVHLIDPQDAGQLRGVSRYAPAIVKLFLLDVYDDAELDRKKIAAMHALFITSEESDAPYSGDDEDGPPISDGPDFDLQPGLVAKLLPGEDIKTSSPAESGNTYEPFQYRTLLQLAAALGIPYSVLSKDTFKATYSSERAATLEFRRQLEAFQHTVIIQQLCRAVFTRWLDLAVLSGALDLPAYDRKRGEYLRAEWLPPKWDWIDPWRDAKAEVEQINAGLKSRTQSIAERGYDIDKVDDERAAEQKAEQDKKIIRPSAGIGHNGGPPINTDDSKSEGGNA